ncbi:uncharacterized protein LOC131854128 [Achroia grisella]|uniref:uncharacterized protein LOC131854128 n=1 Tax=Achroia grisella TaxID=688607 RepID=UPI0027D2A73E|nr:uncharacterized protein LOC131854128 [Achroia grisella]
MNLRTPRRRISPRTKRRYRAIKDFLWRALGNSSQQNIKINSSIAINVTDLKHKIVGLEKQLSNVSKQLIRVESSSRQESSISIPEIRNNISETKEEQAEASCERNSNGVETKVLYKTSESQYRKSDDSESVSILDHNDNNVNVNAKKFLTQGDKYSRSKLRKNRDKIINRSNATEECHPDILHHKTRSVYDNFVTAYSTSSYHSLIEPKCNGYIYNDQQNRKYNSKYERQRDAPEFFNEIPKKLKDQHKRIKPHKSMYIYEDLKRDRSRRDTHEREVDRDFIADLIRKQYKQTRIFGKRESDISQFSAPVCRDQEYTINENILEGSELCSCCYDGRRRVKYVHENDLNDMRSICDTRLYSSKRNTRHKYHRRYVNNYNDSTLYDLIPVKEKSSPKSRRKFIEDSQYYKEVPPSPRTLRPRLNLKAQYSNEIEDEATYNKRRNRRRRQDYGDTPDSNESIGLTNNQKQLQKFHQSDKINQIQQGMDTMSSLQSPISNNEQGNGTTNDISLNKSQESDSCADKTDKALCEIKEILQSFLQEIKKESISQCGKSEISNKSGEKRLNDCQNGSKINAGMIKNNSEIGINNFSMSPSSLPPVSPFIPAFTNPCCYPLLPLYPMNYMQNGYVVPSPSYTCANCTNNKEEVHENNQNTTNDTFNTTANNETDQLIKEIYNLVTQSPKSGRKKDNCDRSIKVRNENTVSKMLTSRSVGGSSKMSKHDVKVGTPKIKCYSKSCEAIGSPHSDTYYSRTNSSYSDTVLEKLSLEATATDTVLETEISSDPTTIKKGKGSKFANVLRSFGFLKKKKNDAIEELSESESTIEVDVKKKSPFRQEVTNYMMQGQEYFHQPPIPSATQQYQNPQFHQHCNDYSHCCGPNYIGYQSPILSPYKIHSTHREHENLRHHHHYSPQEPTAPYPNSFHNYPQMQTQVPLCLKEIEVKNIATQSDRKMAFFKKLTKRMQPPTTQSEEDPQKNCSTQTAMDKPVLFNWKNLQAKQNVTFKNDPLKFSHKTQKELANGDANMRNAMLKKLFYKRNPFSPRNLIVRTLLGKDKSSFGDPPMMYRPRMFF